MQPICHEGKAVFLTFGYSFRSHRRETSEKARVVGSRPSAEDRLAARSKHVRPSRAETHVPLRDVTLL